jgi:hypothetical protein
MTSPLPLRVAYPLRRLQRVRGLLPSRRRISPRPTPWQASSTRPPKRDNNFILFDDFFTPSSIAIYFLAWHSANEVWNAEFEREEASLRALSATARQSGKAEPDRSDLAREMLVNE